MSSGHKTPVCFAARLPVKRDFWEERKKKKKTAHDLNHETTSTQKNDKNIKRSNWKTIVQIKKIKKKKPERL